MGGIQRPFSTRIVLLDMYDRELCSYKKRCGFDVYVPAEGQFLESVLITGLAVVEHKRSEDEEWEEAIDAAVSVFTGGM